MLNKHAPQLQQFEPLLKLIPQSTNYYDVVTAIASPAAVSRLRPECRSRLLLLNFKPKPGSSLPDFVAIVPRCEQHLERHLSLP